MGAAFSDHTCTGMLLQVTLSDLLQVSVVAFVAAQLAQL